MGPSDKWEYTALQEHWEKMLDAVYVIEESPSTPAAIPIHISRKWIEWAWKIGDPTVWKYAEKRSFPEVVTYHDSIHSANDFPIPDTDSKVHLSIPPRQYAISQRSAREMVKQPKVEEANNGDDDGDRKPAIAIV